MKSALSVLDLLFMSDIEQQTIRCLNEYPNSTAGEIAAIIQVSESDLLKTLRRLVSKAKIVEEQRNGQSTDLSRRRIDHQRRKFPWPASRPGTRSSRHCLR